MPRGCGCVGSVFSSPALIPSAFKSQYLGFSSFHLFLPLPLMNTTFHLTGRRSTWTLALHDVRALPQSLSTLRLSTQTNLVILQCDDFLTSYD